MPPRAVTWVLASSREKCGSPPVKTKVLPPRGEAAGGSGGKPLHPGFLEFLDQGLVALIGKKFPDAGGHLFPHPLHMQQFFLVGGHQVFQALEVLGQKLGRGLAHVADAQGVDQAPQGRLLYWPEWR